MLRYFKVLFVLALASCAVGPTSGSVTSTSEISFDGFIEEPSLRVRLDAFDYNANTFGGVRWVTAASAPTFAAGAICPDSPALYRFSGKIDLIYPFWWKNVDGTYQARVRAVKVTSSGSTPLFFTANPDPGICMAENAFNNTCTFSNVAVKCGFTLNEATVRGVGSAPWNN